MIKPGIGYIHVNGFQETTEHEVAVALDQLQEQGELEGPDSRLCGRTRAGC